MSDNSIGGIVDADVHAIVPGGLGALFPYLDHNWQKRLEQRKEIDPLSRSLNAPSAFQPYGNQRRDAVTPSGGFPGSDPQFTAQQLLDGCGVDIAILLPVQPARLDQWTDADEAAILSAAYNDYMADHWLTADRRYRLAMVVAAQDPILAAAEIRRFGATPGVAGVWLPPREIAVGNRYYNPIYEAAAEAELPIILHVTGSPAQMNRTGRSNSAEFYATIPNLGLLELASLVFEGALERFPSVKFVFTEYGWTWVPSALWRMDQTWKSARHAVPWVRQPPSEYVLDRVRFTSQPALDAPTDEYLRVTLEMMSAHRTLLFSSDYPHWDTDDPRLVFRGVSRDLKQRIFRDSAIETFGGRLLAPTELRA